MAYIEYVALYSPVVTSKDAGSGLGDRETGVRAVTSANDVTSGLRTSVTDTTVFLLTEKLSILLFILITGVLKL